MKSFNKILYMVLTITMTLVLNGCLGENAPTDPVDTSAQEQTNPLQDSQNSKIALVRGKVTDVSGRALPGARVYSATGQESFTNEYGEFNLTLSFGHQSVSAEMAGYTQNGRSLEINGDETLDLVIRPADMIEHILSDEETDLTIKGARVQIPANAFVTENGTSYEGNVTIHFSYNRVTSAPGAMVFPGDFIGLQQNGEETPILSYGFIEVTLRGENGEELSLADGMEATLTYPVDENIEPLPENIPLWYYDTQRGIWVEDGVATFDQASQSYIGSVTHFTVWNLDAKVVRASIYGCIEDENGTRVTDATLRLTTPGWSRSMHNLDSQGTFGFINAPSETPMELYAISGNHRSETLHFTLEPGETRQLSECLLIDPDINASLEDMQIKGRILYQDGTPYEGSYVEFRDMQEKYLGYASLDAGDGTFISNLMHRIEDNKIMVVFYPNDIVSGMVKRTFILNSSNVITDIGTIIFDTSSIRGCLKKPDNSLFTENGIVYYDSPFLTSYYQHTSAMLSPDGSFTLQLEKSYNPVNLYFYTDINTSTGLYKYTKKITVTPDADIVNTGNDCITMELPIPLNKTVDIALTTTDPDMFIRIIRTQSAFYGEEFTNVWGETLLGEEVCNYNQTTGNWECQVDNATKNTSFMLRENGVYYIMQAYSSSNSYSALFSGDITITIDGTTHTVTLPGNTQAQEWTGFAIEVYQGEYKVVPLNKQNFYGEAVY